jgi:hypothetical protein
MPKRCNSFRAHRDYEFEQPPMNAFQRETFSWHDSCYNGVCESSAPQEIYSLKPELIALVAP